MPAPTTATLTDDQIALLHQKVLAHVATVMPDGSPQVTPVWVDTDGEAILFNTAKGRIKHRNLVRDPRVAISVADPDDLYRTVVVTGRAELIDQGAVDHINRLSRKYRGSDYDLPPGQERVTVRVVPRSIHRG